VFSLWIIKFKKMHDRYFTNENGMTNIVIYDDYRIKNEHTIMNHMSYSSAQTNMIVGIEKLLNNKFIKDFIPEQIVMSLEALMIFFKDAKHLIFADGKILNINLLNIIRWYKFVRRSHQFIKDIYNIWK